MKPTTTENLIADQLFKISKSDESIREFLKDCEVDNRPYSNNSSRHSYNNSSGV